MADDDGSEAASSSPFLYVEGNHNEIVAQVLSLFCSLLTTRASR